MAEGASRILRTLFEKEPETFEYFTVIKYFMIVRYLHLKNNDVKLESLRKRTPFFPCGAGTGCRCMNGVKFSAKPHDQGLFLAAQAKYGTEQALFRRNNYSSNEYQYKDV